VLGAAMFMVEVAGMRCLYTGDYSRTPDRHMPIADVPPVQPDIGEETYAVKASGCKASSSKGSQAGRVHTDVLALCNPSVIIESTYGVSRHLSREERELQFLTRVHNTVKRGGRVLLPVVALGRSQVGRCREAAIPAPDSLPIFLRAHTHPPPFSPSSPYFLLPCLSGAPVAAG
jgi:cleavage and polyadenylation specificity factor subunit 3